MWARIQLGIAISLFGVWIACLGGQAFRSARFPVVSRAQLLNSQTEVVAEVVMMADGRPSPQINVREVISPNGEQFPLGNLDVSNLADVAGFAGAGRYVLLLSQTQGKYQVVALPRSPGLEYVPQGDRPTIYPDVPAVRKQVERFRSKRR